MTLGLALRRRPAETLEHLRRLLAHSSGVSVATREIPPPTIAFTLAHFFAHRHTRPSSIPSFNWAHFAASLVHDSISFSSFFHLLSQQQASVAQTGTFHFAVDRYRCGWCSPRHVILMHRFLSESISFELQRSALFSGVLSSSSLSRNRCS